MKRSGTCRECGNQFQGKHHAALFCSGPCRREFNRRRRDRGAEIYDFLMSGDDDMVKRLKDAYLASDKVKRNGRKSWQVAGVAEMRIPLAYGQDGDKR